MGEVGRLCLSLSPSGWLLWPSSPLSSHEPTLALSLSHSPTPAHITNSRAHRIIQKRGEGKINRHTVRWGEKKKRCAVARRKWNEKLIDLIFYKLVSPEYPPTTDPAEQTIQSNEMILIRDALNNSFRQATGVATLQLTTWTAFCLFYHKRLENWIY